ncbi:transport protein TonB [compost metagenome]
MRNRLPLVISLSVGLHFLLAIALMQIPQSREIIRKIVPVTLVEREKPKPPAPPKPKPKPMPPKPQAAQPKPQTQAKPQTPPRPQPNPPSQPVNDAARSFGVAAGIGGTMEVPLGETLAAESTASAPLRLRFEDDASEALDREPEPIGRLRVTYPELARLAGATGSARVEAWVEADGRVSRVEILEHRGGAAFAQAARDAVRLTRFRPGLRGGVPVACSIVVPVTFTLNEENAHAPD